MTLPRTLKLVMDKENRPRLCSSPVVELQSLRGEHIPINEVPLSSDWTIPILCGLDGTPLEINAEIKPAAASQIGMNFKTKEDDIVIVGYDVPAQKLFVDRRQAGNVDFESSFGRHIHAAPLALGSGAIHLQIFMDRSSVEVFAGGGSVVLTDLFFPSSGIDKVEVYAVNGNAQINHLDAWVLSSIRS